MKHKIDINCDMGEAFGLYKLGDDEALMPLISIANVACGFVNGNVVLAVQTVSGDVARNATADDRDLRGRRRLGEARPPPGALPVHRARRGGRRPAPGESRDPALEARREACAVPAAALAQGAPFKIGTILSVTGPGAFLGDHMKRGMELAIEEINARYQREYADFLTHYRSISAREHTPRNSACVPISV